MQSLCGDCPIALSQETLLNNHTHRSCKYWKGVFKVSVNNKQKMYMGGWGQFKGVGTFCYHHLIYWKPTWHYKSLLDVSCTLLLQLETHTAVCFNPLWRYPLLIRGLVSWASPNKAEKLTLSSSYNVLYRSSSDPNRTKILQNLQAGPEICTFELFIYRILENWNDV